MPLTSSRVRTALLRVMMTALSLVHNASTLVLEYSPWIEPMAFHIIFVAATASGASPGSSTRSVLGNSAEVYPCRPKVMSAMPSAARLYWACGPLPSSPPG